MIGKLGGPKAFVGGMAVAVLWDLVKVSGRKGLELVQFYTKGGMCREAYNHQMKHQYCYRGMATGCPGR